MRGRGWAALAGSALTLIVLTALAPRAMAGADPGWYASHSTDERQALVDYVYLRSGHAPPYSGLAATAAQDIADTIVASGTHEFPLAPELAAEEFSTIRKVGLFARLAEMAPTLFSGAGLATIGAEVAIGLGAYKLYTVLTAPDDADDDGDPNWAWDALVWRNHGEEIFAGATVQQSPGAYLYDSHDGAGVIRWFEEPCEFTGFTPTAGARMQYGVLSSSYCNVYVEEVGLVGYPQYVDYPYLLETDVRPVAPLRPFEPETDEPLYIIEAAPDPGTEVVEEQLPELDAAGNELLRDELDHVTTPGAQEKEDPATNGTKVTQEDRECKAYFGEPEGDVEPGERSSEAEPEAPDWDYDVDEFEGVYNPYTRSTQTVKLRWGTAAWGYRHIKELHGWDIGARLRTGYALQDRDARPQGRPESFVYLGNLEGGPSGVRCRQRVIVSYEEDSFVPVGRHIITSYLEAY